MRKDSERSTGNVFADLGFPNSEQELVKARLTVEIYRLLKERGLTQAGAAKLLGTTQAQVSTLMRCRPVSVSVGRLMEFLTLLGRDIELAIKPAAGHGKGQRGRMSVTVDPDPTNLERARSAKKKAATFRREAPDKSKGQIV